MTTAPTYAYAPSLPALPARFGDESYRYEDTNTGSPTALGSLLKMLEQMAEPSYPSLESLNRRFEASDKSWRAGWLADDVDPCTPE